MDFIAYEDGTIKDELYREDKEVAPLGLPTAARRGRDRVTSNVVRKQAYNYGPLLPSEAAPFVCSPPQVEFRDFDVGKTCTMAVKLTNVSGDFSTFRVMPISPEFSQIVSVEYSPPSRISAGLSCTILIKCKPQQPVDVATEVTVRTAVGYFGIPVKMLTKRSQVVVQPSVLDFATIVIGDTQQKSIVVENRGASPAVLTISGSFKKVAEKTQVSPLTGKSAPFFTVDALTYRVDVAPFSKQTFDVTFAPSQPVGLACEVEFTEKADDGEHRHIVVVKGSATELPVHVTSGDINFDWCFFESTYCAEVRISNASNVAATVTAVVPVELRQVIRLEPPTTCVQAGGSMPLLLVFTPHRDMPETFATAVEFCVKGQTLPATLSLTAKLTERVPAVETTEINCGTLFTNEEAAVPLVVRNPSALPQMMGFLSVPSNIRIFPEAATVLPDESFRFHICALPPGPGEFSQQITLANEYGDKEIISVYGVGETPTLFFSECVVNLPRCPIGSSVSASVVLTNMSKQVQQFSFCTPAACLAVSPSSGSLKPQEGVVVLVTVVPPNEFVEVKKTPLAVQPPLVSAPSATHSKTKRLKSNAESRESSVTHESLPELVPSYASWDKGTDDIWCRRKELVLKCHASDSSLRPAQLQVNVTVVKPLSLLRPLTVRLPAPADPTGARSSRRTLRAPHLEPTQETSASNAHLETANCVVTMDFQEVSLNHASTNVCIIRNDESLPCMYKLQPTDPASPFTVVHYPLTCIPPGGEDVIIVRFRPVDYGSFSGILRLTSDASNEVIIHLRAKCCSTEFAVTVDNAEKNGSEEESVSVKSVVFDTTAIGNVSQVPLLYENKGSFPLDVDFELPQSHVNGWLREQTFFFHPSTFTIPPHGSVRSVAYFDPKIEGLNVQPLLIKAGGFEHSVELKGRATALPVYVILPGVESNCLDDDGQPATLNGGVRDDPVSLQFVPGETKTIILGSSKGGPSFEYSVDNWDEAFEKAGWSLVGVPKQTVTGGSHSTLGVALTHIGSGDSALQYCSFRITIRCSADSANDRTLFLRCTGS